MNLSKSLIMTSKIRSILYLLRIRQYYKNIMIFVGIFFSERHFETSLYFNLLIGFIILCLTSSFNYIINDIRDIEKDRKHSEKLKRKPLASGDLSISIAFLLLVFISCIIVFSIVFLIPNISFMMMVLLLIITGQIYNHLLKNFAFIDILVLSTGYIWRALAGCIIIKEYVSAWLLLAIFEVAVFLSISKRKGDLKFLGNEVAILVNEEKDRGVYSVNFDASNLATGIYVYRLQAGSFVETKKMVLMK